MSSAVKHPGALRRELGVSKKTGKIPKARINKAAKGHGKLAARARLAKTFAKARAARSAK
jgi:hypothetical protein